MLRMTPLLTFWLNPRAPFKGKLISVLDPTEVEEENEKGEKVKPLAPVT